VSRPFFKVDTYSALDFLLELRCPAMSIILSATAIVEWWFQSNSYSYPSPNKFNTLKGVIVLKRSFLRHIIVSISGLVSM
jgi:hypothetical protein